MKRIWVLAGCVALCALSVVPGNVGSAAVARTPLAAGCKAFQTMPGDSLDGLLSISAASADDAWAVGTTTDYSPNVGKSESAHWDGKRWHQVMIPGVRAMRNELLGVATLTPADAWAVGYAVGDNAEPLIEHWNGHSWTTVREPTLNRGYYLSAISAASPSDIWAVGNSGTASDDAAAVVVHWNGRQWRFVPPVQMRGGAALTAVTVLGPRNVWAVGAYGAQTSSLGAGAGPLYEHWDGRTWRVYKGPMFDQTSNPPTDVYMTGVAAASPTDVWATGFEFDDTGPQFYSFLYAHTSQGGLVSHWDGRQWHRLSDLERRIRDPLGVSAENGAVWIADMDSSSILIRRRTTWLSVQVPDSLSLMSAFTVAPDQSIWLTVAPDLSVPPTSASFARERDLHCAVPLAAVH